jgi:C-terminal processing protease CtpA/Prc
MRRVILWKLKTLTYEGDLVRRLLSFFVFASLAACSSGSDDDIPQVGTAACEVDGQKQFVLDNLYAWYLWNDLLPAGIDIADYATPEELITEVTQTFGPQDMDGNPIDRFSFINTIDADTQFFGEGKFEGFGFSYKILDQAGEDIRLTRVFSGSPAANGGLERGQQFVSLDGRPIADIQANEGISAAFGNSTVVFEMLNPTNGNIITPTITKDIVTIDPVPKTRIIANASGGNVGYMELATFISTADPVFSTVFGEFAAAGVDDIIVDLRYNGGGLVSTAQLLGDFLGGFANAGLPFSYTQFNADRAPANNSTDLFASPPGATVNTSRLVIIATQGTASASELVTNSMKPYVDVWIVGDRTFGKPVGQIGLDFCEKRMRPTAFETVNADFEGDYFDGLPVNCVAPDNLNIAVGDDADPNIIAAMSYLNTGACPVAAVPGGQFKAGEGSRAASARQKDRRGPPEREFADAY